MLVAPYSPSARAKASTVPARMPCRQQGIRTRQKILSYYSLDEAALAAAGVITYGSNVKEVTTQISEGSVDAGVVYCTDAYSAGLTPVDEATAEMCGQVIYPAAVLKAAPHPDAAVAFLAYLRTDAAAQVFESVGFAAV